MKAQRSAKQSEQRAPYILMRGERMIQLFRSVYKEIPPQTMLMFLHVAMRGEARQSELVGPLDISSGAVSRSVTQLGEGFRGGGPRLLVSYEDPERPPYKIIELTKEGYAFRDRLVDALR